MQTYPVNRKTNELPVISTTNVIVFFQLWSKSDCSTLLFFSDNNERLVEIDNKKEGNDPSSSKTK